MENQSMTSPEGSHDRSRRQRTDQSILVLGRNFATPGMILTRSNMTIWAPNAGSIRLLQRLAAC